MNRDQYLLLFEKFLAGNATPEDIETIMLYRDKFEVSGLYHEEERDQYKEVENRILEKLQVSIKGKRSPVIRLSQWLATAAAVLLFAFGAFFYNTYQKSGRTKTYSGNVIERNNINPGSNKAFLTLANGKKIVLNAGTTETIIKQGSLLVRKKKDGVLQYERTANVNEGSAGNPIVEYNTITIPRGGQYQVILPDGTKVWLNSASSLKYPTAFTGTDRVVELTGEGYFEVVQNKKMPFKVKFKGEEVEDLGTHFNIMAYDDEGETQTTLIEGSVKVTKGDFYRVLVPGEQTISLNSQKDFIVKSADVADVMAWKNGVFSLQNASIQQIMRQIARWYDVDVVYQQDLKDKIYGGRVSKSQNITEILKDLELTGTIHFKVEGRRITVMQ